MTNRIFMEIIELKMYVQFQLSFIHLNGIVQWHFLIIVFILCKAQNKTTTKIEFKLRENKSSMNEMLILFHFLLVRKFPYHKNQLPFRFPSSISSIQWVCILFIIYRGLEIVSHWSKDRTYLTSQRSPAMSEWLVSQSEGIWRKRRFNDP